MAYSNFDLKTVVKKFGLTERVTNLFPADVPRLPLSPWLVETIQKSNKLALISEKVRSETLVMPILLELKDRNRDSFSIFSGAFLDVVPEQGLNGECDFILTLSPETFTLSAPVFSIVEAKKNDIDTSLGQCAAQLVGAFLYNQKDGVPTETIYGCVTTGTDWKFIRLSGTTLYIDSAIYFINEPERLLGILQLIVNEAQAVIS